MLAVYVSGHGYGHATRVGEVLREVRRRATTRAGQRYVALSMAQSDHLGTEVDRPNRRVVNHRFWNLFPLPKAT